MSASTQPSKDERIAEEAAQWLISLEDDDADLASFATWLQVSPRHIEEFLLVSAVWRAADALDSARRLDIDQLVAQARDNVKWLDHESPRAARTHHVPARVRQAFASRWVAALAMLAVGLTAWLVVQDDSLKYRTDVGEQRIVKLQDGSIVTLNTRSRIKVRIDDHQRSIELTDGEALFDVAPDAQRPFQVFSGEAVVRAVGTQFNVYRQEQGTTVGVLEGIVELSSRGNTDDPAQRSGQAHTPQRLTAGEQASLSVQGALLRSNVEIERMTAWRERRLIFRGESLAAIAEEFNRYNETQLRIDGPATRARLISGVFDADNPASLIAFLERDQQLTVQKRGENVLISGP